MHDNWGLDPPSIFLTSKIDLFFTCLMILNRNALASLSGGEREHNCPKYGIKLSRDLNSVKLIRRLGIQKRSRPSGCHYPWTALVLSPILLFGLSFGIDSIVTFRGEICASLSFFEREDRVRASATLLLLSFVAINNRCWASSFCVLSVGWATV